MGTGKTYSTDYLVDSNGNTGVAGQILVTTATGVNWQDAENTGDNQTQGSLFDSKVVLIDTPNGGLKPYRVITDEYGEWIQVGRFAANAMTTIQGTWSSVSGLSTGISQSETTSFSADFGDSFPDEVRVMGATDFNNWRNTRTIDWVYKVPKGRKWKYFFSGGATNGMTAVPLAGTPSPGTRFGWGVNGAYDGFGRWTNADLAGIGVSDGNVTNPSAAYTTATSNAFNWDGFGDAKLTVNAFGIYSGQDQGTTSFVGSDDPTNAFYDTWPTETSNGTGGTEFSSAVWVLIKIPGGASGGGGDDVYWSESGNDIYNDNTGNVGIGTTSPYAFDTTATKLHVKNTGSSGSLSEIARFEGSSDADGSGGTIRLGTSNDRGIYFEGGRTGIVPYGKIGTTEYDGTKTLAITLDNTGNATFAGSVTAAGISSYINSATAGYFATNTAIPANQIVHVRDNVATSSVNSAGGIKISSSPGNDVFLLKRNATTSSFFALQNSSASEFITVNMASGNVGIGVTGPGEKLVVEGNVFISGGGYLTWNGKGSYVTTVPGNAAGYIFSSSRNPNDGSGAFPFNEYGEMIFQANPRAGYNGGFTWVTGQAAYGATAAPTPKMTLTTAGNVGIGTVSPDAILNISKTSFSTTFTSADSYIRIGKGENAEDGYQFIGFGYNNGSADLVPAYIGYQQTGTPGNYTKGDLVFGTRNVTTNTIPTERMRILGNGSVGIGTDNPSGEGNLSLAAKSTTEGGHLILEKGTSQTEATHIDNAGNTFRIMGGTNASSGAVDFSINHSNQKAYFPGYVGFGVSGPSFPIHAQSSNSSWMAYLYNTSSTGIGAHIETNASGTEAALRVSSIFGGGNNAGLQVLSNGNSYFGRNITTPTQELSTAATPTNFGVYSSEIRLIDTPNGGLKQCRVVTDNYGEWILVGRFAADARANIQGTWSSESGLDTSTSQSTTTKFSADFGDSYPTEVRIMGATDFTKWRDTRTIDFVYGVPEGRAWKYFFSGGAENGMTSVGPNMSGNNKFGWNINGSYDGFGRWVNPAQTSVGMSDTNITNPSAAYTTATANAFSWNSASDAKMTVSATRDFSGQDSYETAGFGADDNVQGFFDVYPSESNNMLGGTAFSSSVWVLIKLPTAISSGSGGGVGNQWTGGPANIHSTNTAYAGIGTSNPRSKLEIYRGAGSSSIPQLTISTGEADSRDWAVGTDVMGAGDLCILQGASVGAAPQSTSANVRMRFTDTTGSKIMFKYDNTTELGTYTSTTYGGSVKRIRMRQGGEIHFGDTTTSAPLGMTEGTWNNFADQDYLSVYSRSSFRVYGYPSAASELMRIANGGSYINGGNVGIGVTSADSKLDIGGDLLISASKTNSTNKTNRIKGQHYTNAEEPVTFMFSNNFSTTNTLFIGGGSTIENAVTSIGFYTGANNTTTQGSLAMIINSGGNVGIGPSVTNPIHKLEVRDGTISGEIAKFSAINPLVVIEASSAGNAALFLKPNATGLKRGEFRVTNASGYGFIWTADTSVGGTAYMELEASSTGGGDLTVKGDVIAYGAPSDKKYKENIRPIESALDKAMQLQGVTFDWKDNDSILDIKEDIGFIAQDVEKVLPELVRENKKGNLSLRYQGITPILLEAIKELKAEIEELKKQIK